MVVGRKRAAGVLRGTANPQPSRSELGNRHPSPSACLSSSAGNFPLAEPKWEAEGQGIRRCSPYTSVSGAQSGMEMCRERIWNIQQGEQSYRKQAHRRGWLPAHIWCWERLKAKEGRGRGWNGYSITDSMGMNLSKLRETLKDREACCAAVHGGHREWTQLSDWTRTILKGSPLVGLLLLCLYLPPPPLHMSLIIQPYQLDPCCCCCCCCCFSHVWLCATP